MDTEQSDLDHVASPDCRSARRVQEFMASFTIPDDFALASTLAAIAVDERARAAYLARHAEYKDTTELLRRVDGTEALTNRLLAQLEAVAPNSDHATIDDLSDQNRLLCASLSESFDQIDDFDYWLDDAESEAVHGVKSFNLTARELLEGLFLIEEQVKDAHSLYETWTQLAENLRNIHAGESQEASTLGEHMQSIEARLERTVTGTIVFLRLAFPSSSESGQALNELLAAMAAFSSQA